MSDKLWLRLLMALDVLLRHLLRRAALRGDTKLFDKCRLGFEIGVAVLKRLKSEEARNEARWLLEGWWLMFYKRR